MMKPFSILVCFLFLTALCLRPGSAEAQSNIPISRSDARGCSISISTRKPQFASGEPISLMIDLKNVGTVDLVVERGTFAHYDITVVFGNGDHVPMTLFGKRKLGRNHVAGSLALLTLKPGEQTSVEIPLSRLFDFSLATSYKVSVTRKVKMPGTNSSVTIHSNEIEIGVDDSFITHVINP